MKLKKPCLCGCDTYDYNTDRCIGCGTHVLFIRALQEKIDKIDELIKTLWKK